MAQWPAVTNYFDQPVAKRYDETSAAMFALARIDPVVDVLHALAGTGRALEFAIGTGRIALPLAQRGVEVAGIELSAAMVDELRAKPGGARIPVTIGDMTTARAEGTFTVAYLVFNTIGNLTTQDAQVQCFANAAAHLESGGAFVVETGLPQLQKLPPGETVVPFDLSAEHLGFDEYDVAQQGLVSHHFERRGEHYVRSSIPFRYTWPAELDLMARLAGMRLEHRWADWDRAPFTSASEKHVSVWRR
jgi:SAM-dependent methyltransferase